MEQYFQGKVAVVTGAAGVICSEIAKDLSSLGIFVVLVGRTQATLDAVAAEICEKGGACAAYACDVTDRDAVENLAERVIRAHGRCDYLINGAGGNNAKAQPKITRFDPRELTGELPEGQKGIYDIDMDAFARVLEINTMGTVLPTMELAKQMIKKGGGAVINFASMNTYKPLTRVAAYAMSKAAIFNFTQFLANYYAPANIRVNAIAPGFFLTEQNRTLLTNPDGSLTARGNTILAHTPMGKFGKPEDLIGALLFLTDDEQAGFINGIVLPVDGAFAAFSGV